MTKSVELKAPAQAALKFLEGAQDATSGGWGVQPGKPADMHAFGWVAMALRSGQMAGLDVSKKTIDRAVEYLDSMKSEDGVHYYRLKKDEDSQATVIGQLSRLMLQGTNDIRSAAKAWGELTKSGSHKDNVTATFFLRLLSHHVYFHLDEPRSRDKRWHDWHAQVRDRLIATADRKGRDADSTFDPQDPTASTRGRLYQTALSTMALEIYYRYPPIYGRKPIPGKNR